MLAAIKDRTFPSLKPTTTTVTRLDGTKFTEADGAIVNQLETNDTVDQNGGALREHSRACTLRISTQHYITPPSTQRGRSSTRWQLRVSTAAHHRLSSMKKPVRLPTVLTHAKSRN